MARRTKDVRTRHEEEVTEWSHGTDLRNEHGYYKLPRGAVPPVEDPDEAYASVTTILDGITDFTYPERWWIASEVVEVARAAIEKRRIRIWHPEQNELVEVRAGDVLLNLLPEHFGPNAGKWWIAKAGGRELQRRANRGTLIHDAMLDWLENGTRVGYDEVGDYAKMLAEARGFALDEGYYVAAVRNAIAWADRHLDPDKCLLAECPVYNFEYSYAGTVDYVGPLRNTDKLILSPAASFDEDPAVANRGELRTGIIVVDPTKFSLDFKGSKSPKSGHRLQAAAYKFAQYYVDRRSRQFHDMPAVDRVANVYVTSEYVHLKEWGSEDDPYTLEDSFAAFLYAAMLFFHMERDFMHSPNLIKSMSIKPPSRAEYDRYRLGGR